MAFARQAGGTLTAAARRGGGTTVALLLPLVTDFGAELMPPGRLDGIETVLLSVTHVGYRSELRFLLRRHGYQVLDVQTPQRGQAVAQAFSEPIHLIIADADADAHLAELQRQRPEAAVLRATHEEDSGVSEAILVRGKQEAEVLARIRRAIAEGR